MKRRGGYTLIEVMICVAVLGISTALAGFTGNQLRMMAVTEMQYEQALLLLEYHGSAASQGRTPVPEVAARLRSRLPDASLTRSSANGTTTLSVAWRDPFGRPIHRELTVFARGGPR